MNQKSSIELKRQAKIQLSGKYGVTMTALLIPYAITFFTTIPLSFMLAPSIYSLSRTLMYYAIVTILQLIIGVFSTGSARLYLNIACGHPFQINDIFYGFKVMPNKSILILLYEFLFGLLCTAPVYIALIVYAVTKSYVVFPFLAIAIIFAIVSTCIINLMFSQTFYLLVDLPRYSAWELMKISARIMKGHKGRLFYLQISFIGLVLLSVCSCYIGLLWVGPYMNATFANFYLDLMASDLR